ncbi:hypothetical protein SAMN05444407_103321 [Chryseobacterium contaminans]|uniref:Uncharacterized protein n=1 Tax=Chryseobacterium contaminans TaxID=1423959 RepID=A0A1M6ZPP3_9FLAO|nr:hypothetical protein SAMN05444407_103321 [Chryseobacterium contaminans]
MFCGFFMAYWRPTRQKFFEFSTPLQKRGMIASSIIMLVNVENIQLLNH